MQLGTRWRFGETPPSRLSADIVTALTEAEQSLALDQAAAGDDLSSGYWTLTWLEGRAICEFDDGTRVLQRASGEVCIVPSGDAAGASATDNAGSTDWDADEDDDWLSN